MVCVSLFGGCSKPQGVPADLAQRTQPTLSSIQRNVFDPYCARIGCHVGRAAESLLNLESQNSYENLVGVPSVQLPALRRVEPYRPDDSYLIRKLENHGIVGEPMPRTDLQLPQEVIDVIRRWIDGGAPED